VPLFTAALERAAYIGIAFSNPVVYFSSEFIGEKAASRTQRSEILSLFGGENG
jgi:hypothetical protein